MHAVNDCPCRHGSGRRTLPDTRTCEIITDETPLRNDNAASQPAKVQFEIVPLKKW
jgi:hypothetical protein